MLAILISRADVASVNIGAQLLALESWHREEDSSRPDSDGGGTVYRLPGIEMREFDGRHLDLHRPADAFEEPAVLVFASRHAGETGPLLTAHHTGNFGPADHGGEENALARACPNAHDAVIEALERHAPDGYEVSMECTHHGPSAVGVPSMFVEVGSTHAEWTDFEGTRAVARAILDLREEDAHRPVHSGGDNRDRRHLVGFGGGHYAPRFDRVRTETSWAIGHICPDWGLAGMDDLSENQRVDVFDQAFDRSEAAYALVDGERESVKTTVERRGFRPVSETWVRETDGVDLAVVREIEGTIGTVDEGLRFGSVAKSLSPGDHWEVIDLPADILDEVAGIDREATAEVLAACCCAFNTEEGGTRPAGTIVVDDSTVVSAVIDRFVDVLERRYDEVERSDTDVIVRTEEFDPGRARTLGIPEGPAFGKLAAGESVEVRGETIPPDVVKTTKERRFLLTWE